MSYCKIIKKNIRKTAIVILLFLAAFSISVYLLHTDQATGSTADNISGYAWSGTIGWISFNCTDAGTCGAVDHGVSVDNVTGDFSGYAWGENVGWISFNIADVTGCPSGTCQPNLASGDVSGWAKALSADGFGWDGWIKLSDTSAPAYGVTLNTTTNKFKGYAWGGDVVGWVSFNCIDTGTCGVSDYAVVYSLPNILPTVMIVAPGDSEIISYLGATVTFTAWSDDLDGNVVAAEWKDYGGVSDTGDCSGGSSLSTNLDLLTETSTFDINTLGLGPHNICIAVRDNKGALSIAPAPKRKVTVTSPTECFNGIDNDGDGYIDNVTGNEDTGCYDLTVTPPVFDPNEDENGNSQCSDGIDNADGDGFCDVVGSICTDGSTPGDPECDDIFDNNEEGLCGNNICDLGETFQTCPQDCSFTWVLF